MLYDFARKSAALDLAPENLRRAEGVVSKVKSGPFSAHVGSILSLPFDNQSFDCVWSANVMQYLTPEEFGLAVEEANRVLKPGGHQGFRLHDAAGPANGSRRL